MPITSQPVVDGPSIHADGSRRGFVDFTFTDGRVVRRIVRAPDATAWANLLVGLPAKVEAAQEIKDAQSDIDADTEVTAHLEASIEQRAVAYLRAAWGEEQAYDAYLLFDRFNTYRLAQGWTLEQVQAGLSSAGLTTDEWDEMKTSYLYLDGGGRPAIMASAKTVQGNWEAR